MLLNGSSFDIDSGYTLGAFLGAQKVLDEHFIISAVYYPYIKTKINTEANQATVESIEKDLVNASVILGVTILI